MISSIRFPCFYIWSDLFHYEFDTSKEKKLSKKKKIAINFVDKCKKVLKQTVGITHIDCAQRYHESFYVSYYYKLPPITTSSSLSLKDKVALFLCSDIVY